MHPSYRRDIDGLRAIAVIGVVIYHAFPSLIPGGFIGVDVFFVISGYLISTIIIENIQAGTFSIRDFYARRVKRIFPALLIVLLACVIGGWFVLLPRDYKVLGRHIAAGASFISNIVLWSESGYFDVAAEVKPLLHLWSLGVEEQFYLVWPILLLIASKIGFSTRWLTWIVIVCSFVLGVSLLPHHPTAAFYAPWARFWELMLGCALAFEVLKRRSISQVLTQPNSPAAQSSAQCLTSDFQSVAGILLIFAGMIFMSQRLKFPGVWALVPTLGACLLISAHSSAFINRTLLAHPAMTFIGTLSYPIYLWHWPLLSFARIVDYGLPPWEIRLCLVLLSFVLAWLTYRFIERPLRFGLQGSRKILLLVLLMVVMFGIGVCLDLTNGIKARLGTGAQQYADFAYDPKVDGRYGTCWLDNQQTAADFSDSCVDKVSDHAKPLLLVWGDSHAARFFPGLRLVAGNQFRFAEFTKDACPAFLEGLYENCNENNQRVLEKITALKPQVVVLFGYWTHQALVDGAETVSRRLNSTIEKLKAIGVNRIIIMGPAPQWETSLPDTLVSLQMKTALSRVPDRTTYGLDPSPVTLDRTLGLSIKRQPGVLYFSVYKALCNPEGCLTRVGNDHNSLTSWDYGHLTTAGASYVATKLAKDSDGFSLSK